MNRFGKDLVAHVTAVDCMHAACNFITDFVPGDKVENDEETREFLGQVVEIFSAAGLSVWQVNPRNPHAHTNLIRNREGDLIIIDLESAVVTPIPAPGQWRSAMRRGNIPIFDDIDFGRMSQYIATNRVALEQSLGRERVLEFEADVVHGELAIRTWHDSEPRIWGRLIRGVFRLFDWKRLYMRLAHSLDRAERSSEAFLERGIERWEAQGRLTPQESATIRCVISSRQAHNALHHMGVHLVLSVVIAVPIPVLRSAARFAWTLAFWVRLQWRRVRRRASRSAAKAANIHTPLVVVLALIPGFGAVAYMASRPLRRKLLIRLMLDQIAFKLPFGLYRRMRLRRLLAPASR